LTRHTGAGDVRDDAGGVDLSDHVVAAVGDLQVPASIELDPLGIS
jgi:hypothetical protein